MFDLRLKACCRLFFQSCLKIVSLFLRNSEYSKARGFVSKILKKPKIDLKRLKRSNSIISREFICFFMLILFKFSGSDKTEKIRSFKQNRQNCFLKTIFRFRERLALWVQVFISLFSIQSHAFISEVLEVKKEIAGYSLILESASEILEETDKFKGIEDEYQAYEKELREFQKTLNEYENFGLDMRDFLEMRNYNPRSIKGRIDFFKNYVRRANRLLKSFQSLTGSPEVITAVEQMETSRTLRALLEDSQTRELRNLRREVAGERIRLERKKRERKFLNEQYAYINRHSRRKGFGIFHPFRNSKDREEKPEKKRKKFLGLF